MVQSANNSIIVLLVFYKTLVFFIRINENTSLFEQSLNQRQKKSFYLSCK